MNIKPPKAEFLLANDFLCELQNLSIDNLSTINYIGNGYPQIQRLSAHVFNAIWLEADAQEHQ